MKACFWARLWTLVCLSAAVASFEAGAAVTVTYKNDPVFYVDSAGSPALPSGYVAIGVRNDASVTGPVVVQLTTSGGTAVLAASENGLYPIRYNGTGLSANVEKTAYFYLTAAATATPTTLVVKVWNCASGNPNTLVNCAQVGSTATLTNAITSVKETTGSADVKVTSVVQTPPWTPLPGTFDLTVTGSTGPAGNHTFAVTPQARAFPTSCYQLVRTVITYGAFAPIVDSLFVPSASVSAADTPFQVVSSYRVNCDAGAAAVTPAAYVAPDAQVRHQSLSGFAFQIPSPCASTAPNGDGNCDGAVNVTDVLYLINYLFAGGPRPVGPADVNGGNGVDVSDVLYLINYLFAGGPPPVAI